MVPLEVFSSNMTTDHLYVLLVQKDMHAISSTAIVGATGFVADLSLCSTGPRVQLKSFGQYGMGVNGLTGTPDITPRAFSANSKSQLQITQLKEAFLIESLIAVQIYCVDLTCWQMTVFPLYVHAANSVEPVCDRFQTSLWCSCFLVTEPVVVCFLISSSVFSIHVHNEDYIFVGLKINQRQLKLTPKKVG